MRENCFREIEKLFIKLSQDIQENSPDTVIIVVDLRILNACNGLATSIYHITESKVIK